MLLNFFLLQRKYKGIAVKQRDIDISLLNGSGPNGRILKIDVEKFNNNKNVKNINIASRENFELVKNSAMRKTIADRLVKSKNEAPKSPSS